jgi:hypothetical protein
MPSSGRIPGILGCMQVTPVGRSFSLEIEGKRRSIFQSCDSPFASKNTMYQSLKLLIALALFGRCIASSNLTDSSKETGPDFFPYESIQLTEGAPILSKAPAFAFGHGLGSYSTTTCKILPGDADWPTQSAWNVFNASVNGALIRTVPIAAPCYDTEWGPKDTARCDEIVSKFTTSSLQYDDP